MFKGKKRFTSRFLDFEKEEDLRKSLTPIKEDPRGMEFTKFVKFKESTRKFANT